MLSPAKIRSADVVTADLEMARTVFAAGNYDEVLKFTEEAILRTKDPRERFALLLVRAAAFGEKGEYQSAVAELDSAKDSFDSASGMSKARYYCQWAYLQVKFGDTNEALINYEEARFWAQKSGDLITEATSRNNIAKLYSAAGRLDEALTESATAIKLGTAIGSDWRLARYHDQRAQILIHHKRFSEALHHCDTAIHLLAENPALNEAQQTYVKAVTGLLIQCTDLEDPVERFRARRSAIKEIPNDLGKETARLALVRCKGNVLRAASLLGITHGALQKVIIYLTHIRIRAKFSAWKTKDHSRRHFSKLSSTFPILILRLVAW